MGDAVMAFWGAPLTDEQHARNAVLAGLDMIRAVANLQEKFKQSGWPPIAVGVGVASGDMNVGNMGSEFRIAYTVMGDVVNLGSRLEGLTKQYGVDMIVSAGTASLLPDFAFRELDLVRVKGKTEPIAIFEPLGPADSVSAARLAAVAEFSAAIVAFRRQDWDAAHSSIQNLRELGDEPLYYVYLDRIERFRREPPPADWDGVFEHLSK
jgi:adenylate cyclase